MTELDNTQFNGLVQRIAQAETADIRMATVKEAVALLYVSDTLKKWARNISTSRGYRNVHGINDVEQVIAEKVLVTLRDVTPQNSDRVSDWLKFLYGLSVNAVKDYLASSQVTVASKMSGLMKRRDIIRRVTKNLTMEYGRTPSQSEIIAVANAWALEHHKDPRKQGLLLSDEDFRTSSMSPVSLDESPLSGAVSDGDEAERSSEAQLALSRLEKTAAAMFPDDADLAVVLKAWTECIAAAERPSQATISKLTNLPPATIRSSLARLNVVLDEVRDLFG